MLLAVELVCTEQGTPVPWNLVAEKVNDYLSGEGIKQHLAKVRKYREQNGRPVPSRSTKGGSSRKAAAYGTGITNTPKKKKGDTGDDGAASGKGAGLLWTNPNAKKPKEPKPPKEPQEVKAKADSQDTVPATPKTPARSRKQNTKANDTEQAASKKKSTGKRSRTKKEPTIKEESEEEYGNTNDSPTKKQRTIRLRPAYHVNYNEAEIAGEEFDDDVFEARSQTEDVDGDDAYDASYWSQPGTVMNSGRGSFTCVFFDCFAC